MAERTGHQADHIAECRLVGILSGPPGYTHALGDPVCRLAIKIGDDEFQAVAKNDLAEQARGLVQGDTVEVFGKLVLHHWKVGDGDKRFSAAVEAERIVSC